MQIDRNKFINELLLREQVRKVIKFMRKKEVEEQSSILKEETELRHLVRRLIKEAAGIGTEKPERSTGINELERVLEEIIKILEQDYKRLTTSEEQRASFRAHIVNGIKNLIATERATDTAGDPGAIEEQEIDIEVGEEEDEAFIDVRGDTEKEEEPEKTPEEAFGLPGEDKTGRNFAYETFKRVENQIVKGYDRLDDQKDKDLFYDYLITNLKLYFDKFEDELQTSVSPEPTTPEYEQEKEKAAELSPGPGLGEPELEI